VAEFSQDLLEFSWGFGGAFGSQAEAQEAFLGALKEVSGSLRGRVEGGGGGREWATGGQAPNHAPVNASLPHPCPPEQ
jgi:hypothetical protein